MFQFEFPAFVILDFVVLILWQCIMSKVERKLNDTKKL